MSVELSGYRRADVRAGVRNHVVILPVDDLSIAVCENTAQVVPGVLALSTTTVACSTAKTWN